MIELNLMKKLFKIMTIFFLFNFNTNVFADDVINKVKKESKSILKTLTRKSLEREDVLKFISQNVINIDDKRGNGLVTYYFTDMNYQRYKDLELISEDKWKISIFGHLQVFDDDKKNTWKIQLGKQNTINIKTKINSIGKLHEFSFNNKTNYYIKLEEKKN